MSSRMEIRTSGSTNEWSEWCREKSGNVLQHLARMAEVVRRLPKGPDREELEENLYPAVWDELKLVAFSTGHKLTGKQLGDWREQICEYGESGYELAANGIGLQVRTRHAERNHRIAELLSEGSMCLELPRGEGRTRLHGALLRAAKEGGTIINKLLDRIELVTMGELSWDAYVAEARPLFAELRRLNASGDSPNSL